MSSGRRNSRFGHFFDNWVYGPVYQYFSSGTTRPGHAPETYTAAADLAAVDSKETVKPVTVALPDGAKLAYEILGSHHLGKVTPVVMICGMTALRTDDERVNRELSQSRPVLVYDHRGMGDSSLSPAGNEEITMELLARDLVFLLKRLGWEEIALCGHSMGGVIAQQLLVLPYHPTNPAQLPFRTTHLFLVATRCMVHQTAGLPITAVPGKPRSLEERREGAKRVIAASVDPGWIEANRSRFDEILARVTNNNLSNRPPDMVAKQLVALKKFHFEDLLKHLPRDIRVLVIHGQIDQVVPFSCGQDILDRIPWARLVEEGTEPGHIPTLNFGHLWYEYFDPQVWHDVFRVYMQ